MLLDGDGSSLDLVEELLVGFEKRLTGVFLRLEHVGDVLDDLEESETIAFVPDLIKVFSSFDLLLHDVGTLSKNE